MAYAPHTLVAFGGTLNTAQTKAKEIWQCGVRLGGGGINDCAAYLAAIQGGLSAWFHANTLIPSVCTLDWVKANNIGADGKYVSPNTFVHDYAPTITGGGVAGINDILTLVLTWTTDYQRGPAHEGRIFLPLYGVGQVSGAAMTASQADINTALAQGKSLLTVLANGVTGGAGYPAVLSKINGADRSITGIKVGDVLDVQRRRKDALKETYTSSTWP